MMIVWLFGTFLTLILIYPEVAAQESLDKIENRHFELTEQAERMLLAGVSPKDIPQFAKVRELLEQATGLKLRTPAGGEFVYRSAKADFYLAWLLCRSSASDDRKRGAQLFQKILLNDQLSPRREELVESESKECDGRQKRSPTFEEKGRFLITAVQKGGRGGSQPINFASPAMLPRVEPGAFKSAEAALSKLLGPAYRVVAVEPFVVAGRGSIAYLQSLTDRVLKPYHSYLVSRIGTSDSGAIFTIVTHNHAEVIAVSARLYGVSPQASQITRDSVIAYSDPTARLMVAVCGKDPTNCTSFAHELFHLLNARTYEDAPWWLYEGMAELFESGDFISDEFVPRVGWRKRDLVIADANTSGIEKLLRLPKSKAYAAEWPGPEAEMAKARFFAQFLHERRKKLWEVYTAMRARSSKEAAEDPSGKNLLTKIVGPLPTLGDEFSQWVNERIVPAKGAPGP